MSPIPALHVHDLDVWFDTRPVLRGIELTAQPGRRIGLVGENGSGKTTLLRAIAGTLPTRAAVSGTVDRPADLAMLGQEPAFADGQTIGDVLGDALAPLRRMVTEVERLSLQLSDDSDEPSESAYAVALDRAVIHDAWDADRRAEEAAERLGLGVLDPGRRIGTLSGGQRTRLALATLMTTRPSCLLLDEPTNHLDDDAIDLVSAFLRDLPGVVLLASHDRVLLDDVCTDLFDLDPRPDGGPGRTDRVGGASAAAGRRTRNTAPPHVGAGRRRTPSSRRSSPGCALPPGWAPRRSRTTGPRGTTTSSSTGSRAPGSSAPHHDARRTRSGASSSPSVTRRASRARRSGCGRS
jgi:macrolide transport system ATP-binding/permease protein